jgi:Myosin-like coiled-coil protein
MEEMSKKTKRLEKENTTLTRKHEATNQNILKMAEERTRQNKDIETLRKQNEKLEKLCRGMQAQGRGQAVALPQEEDELEDGEDEEGTDSEYDEYDEEDAYEGAEYDDDTEEEPIEAQQQQQQQQQRRPYGPPRPYNLAENRTATVNGKARQGQAIVHQQVNGVKA